MKFLIIFSLVFISLIAHSAKAELSSNEQKFNHILSKFEAGKDVDIKDLKLKTGFNKGKCFMRNRDPEDSMFYIKNLSRVINDGPDFPVRDEIRFSVALIPTYNNESIKNQSDAKNRYDNHVQNNFFVEHEISLEYESIVWISDLAGVSCGKYDIGCGRNSYTALRKNGDTFYTVEWTSISGQAYPLTACYFYDKF